MKAQKRTFLRVNVVVDVYQLSDIVFGCGVGVGEESGRWSCDV